MALTVPVFGTYTTPSGVELPIPPIRQAVSYTTNGFSADVTQTQFPLQLGVPMQPIYMFRVIPAETSSANTSTTDPSHTCVAEAQTLSGNGPFTLTLRTTDAVSSGTPTVSTLSKAVTYNGDSVVMLDCERCLSFVFTPHITKATTITVEAYDYRGVPMTISKTYASETGLTSDILANPVSIIKSITFSSNPFATTGTVNVGNSFQIGFPYLLTDTSQITQLMFNDAVFQSNIYGEFLINPGTKWRQSGQTPTSATDMGNNPTRGWISTTEIPDNGSLPDGNAILSITYYVAGADSELNANVQNLNQSALGLLGVVETASDVEALPYITQGDLLGLQWNDANTPTGQVPFINAYVDLLAS